MASARWFSPVLLLLVMAGGAVGVVARAVIVVPLGAFAHPLVVPAVTLLVNVVGSLLLGIVVGALGTRRPRLRAFVGTGVLGGFTTYSAFAVSAVTTASAAPVVGLLLVAASLFGGLLAAGAGLSLGARMPEAVATTAGDAG